jgi:hypothetical protein
MDDRSIRYYNKSGLKDEILLDPSVMVGVDWTSGYANREFGPMSGIFFLSGGTRIDLGHYEGFPIKDVRRAWPYVVKLIRRHNLGAHYHLEVHLKCMRGPGRFYWNDLYEELVIGRRADRELDS